MPNPVQSSQPKSSYPTTLYRSPQGAPLTTLAGADSLDGTDSLDDEATETTPLLAQAELSPAANNPPRDWKWFHTRLNNVLNHSQQPGVFGPEQDKLAVELFKKLNVLRDRFNNPPAVDLEALKLSPMQGQELDHQQGTAMVKEALALATQIGALAAASPHPAAPGVLRLTAALIAAALKTLGIALFVLPLTALVVPIQAAVAPLCGGVHFIVAVTRPDLWNPLADTKPEDMNKPQQALQWLIKKGEKLFEKLGPAAAPVFFLLGTVVAPVAYPIGQLVNIAFHTTEFFTSEVAPGVRRAIDAIQAPSELQAVVDELQAAIPDMLAELKLKDFNALWMIFSSSEEEESAAPMDPQPS
jgi:hypothetical protein